MNKKVFELINEQVNKEFYSAYIYLDMANYYTNAGLSGFANWFRVQAMEERDHAYIFIDYLQDNGESVNLLPIGKPEYVYNEHIDPLKYSLKHEQSVTASINAIYKEAFQDNDYRAMQFLTWFIKEQGEEEKNADDLIKKMELYGEDAKSLYLLNSELEARIYSAVTLADI